ncbi:MAG: BON domain-containing protein [Betaproteobacteria bacterium]|nr:MAG: BON domain-containing protein [Betaproteobacteria bacterium]
MTRSIQSMLTKAALALAATGSIIAISGCAPLVIGGAVAVVAMTEDRRSTGVFIDDENIENRAILKVKSRFGSQVHINITSYNLHVLISGEVPTEAVRQQVEEEVRGIGKITRIHNELVVGPLAGVIAVSNDTRLTGLVKTRFLEANRFQVNHVKVVTEAGVVFLMGIVRRAEADAASQLASTTSGVRSVVRLFEYLD